MKTKQVSKILAMALSGAALAVYGCGGGGGTTAPATTTPTTGTTITGATPAASASGSSTQSAGVGSNSGQTLSNLAAVGSPPGAPQYRSPLAGKDKRFNKLHAAEVKAMKVPQMKKAAFLKKAKALAAGKKVITFPGTAEPCTDGGTVTISGTVDEATFAYSMTMTFTNCRDMDTESSGTITNSGAFSATGGDTSTMVLGDGDGTIETTDFRVREFTDNYTNLFAAFTADMTMSGSGDPTLSGGDVTGYTFTYTGNGKEEYTDFIDTYTFAFTNLIFSSTSTGLLTTTASGSDTINGKVSESWTEGTTANSVVITFGDADTSAEVTTDTNPDFTIAWETDWATYKKYSVDGQVATDYTTPSDADCFDGTFFIDTTTQIYENLSTGLTTAGQMTVNTNTTVTFNADGTVTVTVSGQTPTSYTSKDAMEAVCKIEDMEDDTSETTNVSTGGQTQSTTGSTMTITALSSYPANSTSTLNCFTDVHVNYYNTTTPVTATTGTWYVDWHTNDSCTSPTGLTFEQARDITGDGICDVGLDINGSAQDSSSNGTEHFTALALPSGYYVVSINNWSCAADVKSDVSIKIGSDLFTGFSGTYTAAGTGESTTGAWYRVTDIRVNADGTVNLLAPDTTLPPWHSGTFGMAPPMKARGLK